MPEAIIKDERSFIPKYFKEDFVEVLAKDTTWNAGNCHSYMLKNIGNTNVTVFGVKVLTPGEWWCSDTDDPLTVNITSIRVEFDKNTGIYAAALIPGRDPNPVNDPFDPNNPPPRDNRLEICKSYLKPNPAFMY
ncbi:MAG: hypothetical protein V4722_04305 [Bacteroidota bacterium]